jgi:hypothetical protein
MDKKLNSEFGSLDSAPPLAKSSRFRFSLQAMFIATTVFAGFCYLWFVLPSVQANRLVSAIDAADYASADILFGKSGTVSFAKTNERTFGFRANASLFPWSFSDICLGRRSIQVETDYMAFDEHLEKTLCVVATPLGLKQPVGVSSIGSVLIDGSPRISRKLQR